MKENTNNSIGLIMYKSKRTNSASTDLINVYHLISKEEITDERILSQFVGTIEKVVHESKKFNNHVEMSAFVHNTRNLEYKAVNGMYETEARLCYAFSRQKFYSIESCINFIHSLYLLIYPNTKLHLNTIYDNPSIKYFVNQYYNS